MEDKYRAVQYGWPFNAYEVWWKADDPVRVESAPLIGSILDCMLATVLCALGRRFGMRWDRRRIVTTISPQER